MVSYGKLESIGDDMFISKFGITTKQKHFPKLIGNPFTIGTYAKNVWDMQLFDGKIYLGHGNGSNNSPDANSGVSGIIYLNPATGLFTNEYNSVQDRQINIYKIIDGDLRMPGLDRLSGTTANYYRYINGAWDRKTTLPHTNHVFDLAYKDGILFAGTASSDLGTYLDDVFVSNDDGAIWTNLDDNNGGRLYKFFELKGLYIAQLYLVYIRQILFLE